jgi:phosphoribosylformylglycinamidine cyclo-ligase
LDFLWGNHTFNWRETAADVGDIVRTIIVDSTVTARMKRSKVIDNANIKAGDVIVGLASLVRLLMKKSYNGGMEATD